MDAAGEKQDRIIEEFEENERPGCLNAPDKNA
jgi:hypothetical protein